MDDRTTGRLRLRPVRPGHRALLIDGFERLSDRSRYLRFFTPKPRLTPGELRYLTQPDGVDHFALGAAVEHADGTVVGLGVGRYVRAHDDPEVAHVAITVVDEAQGHGLGARLLRGLGWAARLRGVRRFRFTLLPENIPLRTFLSSRGVPMVVEDRTLVGEWRTREVSHIRTARSTRALTAAR